LAKICLLNAGKDGNNSMRHNKTKHLNTHPKDSVNIQYQKQMKVWEEKGRINIKINKNEEEYEGVELEEEEDKEEEKE